MTIDDKLNLIALLEAVRPYIERANNNAENDHDNMGEEYYHYSIIIESNAILDRIDKSINILRANK